MTLTLLLTIANTVQAFVVSIATLVGGGWAFFRFRSLGELEEAKTKLEQLKQSIKQRGTVEMLLETRFIQDRNQHASFLIAGVSCSNVGSRPEVLRWEEGRVWSAKLLHVKDGCPVYSDWLQSILVDNKGPVIAEVLSPGSKTFVEFLVPISETGIYAVIVTVPGSSEETNEALGQLPRVGMTAQLPGQAVWSAMKLIEYPEPPTQK